MPLLHNDFDIRDHYWTIGGSAGVWSSASGKMVPVSDAGFLKFIANDEHRATPVASFTELYEVLLEQAPDIAAAAAPGWIAANELSPAIAAQALLAAGLAITSKSTPTLNATYALDPASQMKISSLTAYIGVNS